MKKYLIVDAYNMINQWSDLKVLVDENLEEAREKLTTMMQNYVKIHNFELILVFDAYNTEERIQEYIVENGIVVFTQKNQTADSYIERLLYDIPQAYEVYVATSDYNIQRAVISRGGIRLSALELEKEVAFTLSTYLKRSKENYEREKNNLFKLIDEDTLNKLQKLKNDC